MFKLIGWIISAPYRLFRFFIKIIVFIVFLFVLLQLISCSSDSESNIVRTCECEFQSITDPNIDQIACYDGIIGSGIAKIASGEEAIISKFSGFTPATDDEVRAFSSEAHAEILKSFSVVHDKKVSKIFDRVIAPVRRHPRVKHTKIFVIKPKIGEVWNAFATGNVYITTDLLDWIHKNQIPDKESQIAAVIGHELGHILRLDIHRGIAREKLSKKLLGQDFGTGLAALWQYGHKGLGLNVQNEIEADLVGVALCYSSKFDPMVAPEIWHQVARESNGSRDSWTRVLGSHPHPRKRANCLHTTLSDRCKISHQIVNK